VINDDRQPGMIADVSLRVLYLLFQQVLGLILLMGRTPPPRTSSSSCCGTRSPYLSHARPLIGAKIMEPFAEGRR
jgi:hypothetical protein